MSIPIFETKGALNAYFFDEPVHSQARISAAARSQLTEQAHQALLESASNARVARVLKEVGEGIANSYDLESTSANLSSSVIRLSPNEEGMHLRQANAERRALRLQQVRDQEKLHAARLVAKMREQKRSSAQHATAHVKAHWTGSRNTDMDLLKENYTRSVVAIGGGHKAAGSLCEMHATEADRELKLLQINKKVEEARHKQALTEARARATLQNAQRLHANTVHETRAHAGAKSRSAAHARAVQGSPSRSSRGGQSGSRNTRPLPGQGHRPRDYTRCPPPSRPVFHLVNTTPRAFHQNTLHHHATPESQSGPNYMDTCHFPSMCFLKDLLPQPAPGVSGAALPSWQPCLPGLRRHPFRHTAGSRAAATHPGAAGGAGSEGGGQEGCGGAAGGAGATKAAGRHQRGPTAAAHAGVPRPYHVPCCAVPCCAVPCSALLCHAVPCRAVLHCAVLCCAVL